MKLLPAAVQPILDDQRALLGDLQALLKATDAAPKTLEAIGDIMQKLDALFLVVIVGEFNAGKSSVVNALFGEKVMKEGPIPTTDRITVLRYGDVRTERSESEYLVERRYPSPLLRHLELVDTPGTNSIIKQHQTLTEQFVPRADLVLFVTSYDRPLTDSEQQFLTFLRGVWGKRLVFVLNKADLARSEEDLAEVLNHIISNCQSMMNFTPEVFPVSAELAYAAKHNDVASARETLWAKSKFEPFEAFFKERLTGTEQLRMKLQAPLDVVEKQLQAVALVLQDRRQVLEHDEANLADLAHRLEETRTMLQADYQRHLDAIDALLGEMKRRGTQFLDDTIRVSKIQLLKDRDQFKEEFARQVLRDIDRQIEDRVTDGVDSLLKHALTLWNQVLSDFAERVRSSGRGTNVQGSLDYNRSAIFQAMMKEAQQRLTSNDLREEARRILENARNASDQFQAAQLGAAGLGIIGTVLIVATGFDAVGGAGLVTGSVLALTGLTVLPRQRRKAIREFEERTDALRDEMRAALADQFEREVTAALTTINGTTQPYRTLVETERQALKEATQQHQSLETRLAALVAQVENV